MHGGAVDSYVNKITTIIEYIILFNVSAYS